MRYLSQQDFSKIPVKGFALEAGAAAPDDPADFQLWGDTTTGRAKWHVPGVGWMAFDDVADGSITNAKVPDGALSLTKLAVDPLDRANHTGSQPASSISDLAAVVKAYRLDEFAAPTAPVDAGGQRITNGAAPTQASDYAIKSYVDQAIADARAGIAGVKDPVKVAAQGNVNLAAPGATIDGVAMTAGDRFLAPVQDVGTQNGIYTWTGAASAATRATDADTAGEVLDGTLVAVSDGTDAGKQYIQQATPSGAPGSWTQQWTVYSTGGNSYIAGDGIDLDGNAFSVKAADGSITVSGSGVTVGLVPVAKGGTGATDAAGARTALGTPGRYAGNVPALTAGTWTSVTHNLGTEDIVVSVRDATSKEAVGIDWKPLNTTTVQLRSDVAVSANALRVVVVG